MKNILLIVGFCSLCFLFSCDDDGLGDGVWSPVVSTNPGDRADVGYVNEGLFNGDMEIENSTEANLPSGWNDRVNSFNSPNNYEFFHVDVNAIDERSARLFGFNIDSQNEYGYFRQVIVNPKIPTGAFVRVRAKVRTESLAGRGFNLVAIGYDLTGTAIFGIESFQETSFVRGTTDWTEYVTEVGSYPGNLNEIQIWLAIGSSTTGNVYFDDVVLEID